MLGGNQEDDNKHVFGSAMNPKSLHYGDKEDKEIAKPGVQMVVKPGNRNPLTGGAMISKAQEEEIAQKKKEAGKDIWNDQEVNVAAEERPDDRPSPEYEILHK